MVTICTSITVASLGVLYHFSIEADRERLVELVRAQAYLAESVAEFDQKYSAEDHVEGAKGATLDQLTKAMSKGVGFGSTGEFVLGRIEGDQIVFHFHSRSPEKEIQPVPIGSYAAGPMQLALLGKSGSLTSIDYDSIPVFAAYEPLPTLGYGLVAKIDLEELRAPFIKAATQALMVAVIVIGIAIFFFRKLENSLKQQRERFFYLVFVMFSAGLCVTGVSIFSLYESSIEVAKSRIFELVKSEAYLMNSVAAFDKTYSREASLLSPRDATIGQILNAYKKRSGFGITGEFALAEQRAGGMHFIGQTRQSSAKLSSLAFESGVTLPMQRALSGSSGVLEVLNYKSEPVLTAFAPVPLLKLGLVAKIDMRDVRSPFIRAGAIAGAIAIITLVFGALILVQVERPFFEKNFDFPNRSVTPGLILFTFLLAAAILFLDLMVPLGVAGGTPYVGLVLIGWWYSKSSHILYISLFATLLTVLGYHLSQQGAPTWIVLTNRGYSFFAIWITGFMTSIAKSSEVQREKQAYELQKQHTHKKALIHLLSHDLSNPLGCALGLSKYLVDDPSEVKTAIPSIIRSLKNSMDIVESIRLYMALEEGKFKLKLVPCNLKEMVEESVATIENTFKEKNLKFKISIDEDTSILVERVSFLNTVLNNLLNNASKFSFPEETILIKSSLDKNGWVVIDIRDTGVGISEERLKHLFDIEFSSSSVGTKGEKGTGFGMPLVKKFIESYDGSISITSTPGSEGSLKRGTLVTLKVKSA